MFKGLILIFSLFLFLGCNREEGKPADGESGSIPVQVPEVKKVASKGYKPEDVILKINDVSLTWGQFSPYMLKNGFIKDASEPLGERSAETAKVMLKQLTMRHLLNLEAKRREIEVSDSEREHYLGILEKSLAEQGKPASRDSIMKQFTSDATVPFLEVSLDDTIRIVKLNEDMIRSLVISEEELNAVRAGHKRRMAILIQTNKDRRLEMEELLAKPEIKTDRGFKLLAKNHSDGIEAKRGGVVGTFTREEVALEIDEKEFTVAVGETSGVFESPTALRIMRVLKEEAPEKEGGAARFQVAQILRGKVPIEELPEDDDKLRELVKTEFEMKRLQSFAVELLNKHDVTSPLFPQGFAFD